MSKIKFLILVLFLALVMPSLIFADNNLVVTPGKYTDYYHLLYRLTPQNTIVPSGYDKYGAERKMELQDGQFEVFIATDQFPIETSPKTQHIILRMPNNNDPACTHIFEQISTMLKTGEGDVPVVIELNPYVKKISSGPLKLVLTQPNVFFRMAHGKCAN